jgi:hypothetical protein
MFVCILGKCSEKYYILCIWSNVKRNKKKNPHPKPPKSTKNRNHHYQPPQPTPKSTPQPTTAKHSNPPKSQQKPVGHRLMREIREAVVLRCKIGVRGGGCCSRSAPARGAEWCYAMCKKERESRKGEGERLQILENGLQIFWA